MTLSSFGGPPHNGIVTTDFNGSSNTGFSLLQQSDGKFVVSGVTGNSIFGDDFALSRYNSNGSLDTTFGTGGKVTTDFFTISDAGYSALQQSDGKIVVAGYTATDFALSRYNIDGSLDTTFGNFGKVTTNFNNSSERGYSILQQSDGKIVVAGDAFNGFSGGTDFALSPYNIDGSLDTTFGGTGKVFTTDFNSSSETGYSVLQQSDGKIVVAGYSNLGGNNFALNRYNSNGSLDTTFGTGGKVTTDFNNSSDLGYSLALQPDGKIILVGTSNGNFAIARYLADAPPPINSVPGAQSVNEDTTLSITGISVTDSDNNLATSRLTVSNGTLNVVLTGGASISAGSNSSATLTLGCN